MKTTPRSKMTRRNVIAGLGTAPLAAALAHIPAASAMTDVQTTIERHKAAWQAFEDSCWHYDELDPRYAFDTPENNAAIYEANNEAEETAFLQFMEIRPRTLQEVSAKSDYLLAHLRGGAATHKQLQAFLKAMI